VIVSKFTVTLIDCLILNFRALAIALAASSYACKRGCQQLADKINQQLKNLPLGLVRAFEAGDFAGVEEDESARGRFLDREGNAGDARIGRIGSGRSANGKCSTRVPKPMIFGRFSFG
jgi:hypothetical protein